MAISPNDDFTAGQILTYTECNNWPRGVMAYASSGTSYTLTTSDTLSTGMTVTFTAVANRNYKITYFEPQVDSPSVAASTSNTRLHITDTAGLLLQQGFSTGLTAAKNYSTINLTWVGTLAAGSITIIGSSLCSVTTGTPLLQRNALVPAFLIVEDIGTA
jgi:hypothetical protein